MLNDTIEITGKLFNMTTIIDYGEPAPQGGSGGGAGVDPGQGFGADSGLWTDRCPVPTDPLVWPTTGDKDLELQCGRDFDQDVTLEDSSTSALTPILTPEIGPGSTVSVAGFIPLPFVDGDAIMGPCAAGDPSPGYFLCSDCGSYVEMDATTFEIMTGKNGTIYSIAQFGQNVFCGRFYSEQKVEALFTDSTGVRGLRLGVAFRITSDQISFAFSSDPKTRITIPGRDGDFPLSAVTLQPQLKWTIELDYYIKTSCDLTDSYAEKDEVHVKFTQPITTIACLNPIAMSSATASFASEFKDTSAVYVTGRAENTCQQIGFCSTDPVTSWIRSCFDPVNTTYTWQEPADAEDHDYYTLNSAAIETELVKHRTDLFRQLTNFDLSEAPWMKYPLFGPAKLGIKKVGATIELTLLGAGLPKLTWTDPFVNRILLVGYAAGTTQDFLTPL